MITSAKEYLSRLQDIRDANLHTETLFIPSDELVYEVDLNKRTIDSPVFLSTETDHIAETVFFKTDRYFETHDLAQSTCIIQYINANNEAHVYIVPIFDIETFADEGKILIPWVIQGYATAAPGTIKYAIRFYHLNKIERPEGTEEGVDYEFDYIINTQVAQSKILHGMGETYLNDAMAPIEEAFEEIAGVEDWEKLFNDLNEMKQNGTLTLY
jgi:hypothetical protein